MSQEVEERQDITHINDIVSGLLGELTESEEVVDLHNLGLGLLQFLLLCCLLLQMDALDQYEPTCRRCKRTSCAATIFEYAALVSFKKI